LGGELKLLAAVITAALNLFICSAHAVELKVLDDKTFPILLVSGEYLSNDDQLFKRALAKGRDGEVWFDSEGGSLRAGIIIGNIIRQQGLATRVPNGAICASACVYSFMGGVVREVDAKGKVGVHMASLMFNDEFIAELRGLLLLEEEIDLNTRIQLIVSLSEGTAARALAIQVDHIVKMGVSLKLLNPSIDTHHLDVYWLSRRELRDFNVVNVN